MRYLCNSLLRYLLFAFVLISGAAQAKNSHPSPIVISPEFTELKIGQRIFYLEDPSGLLTLDQMQAPENASQFLQSTKDSLGFGYSQSAFWVRFDLQHPNNQPSKYKELLYLVSTYAPTDLIELWCKDASGTTVVQQKAGDHVPRNQWTTSYREPTFKITKDAATCWLRVENSTSVQIPLKLYSDEAFVNMRLLDTALQAVYFGALVLMFIYNCINAAITRSKAYLSYATVLLLFGFFQLHYGGLGYAYLWPFATGKVDALTPILVPLIAMGSLFFTATLLDLRTMAPRWYIANKIVFCILFFPILALFFVENATSIRLTILIAFLWLVVMLGAGLHLAVRKNRVAKIFVIAWVGFIIGVMLVALAGLGWIPINEITVNAAQIGSAFELVALNSLALADRFNKIRKDKMAYQQKLLDAEHALVLVLQSKEEELEQRVSLRTAELKAANYRISMAFDLALEAKRQAQFQHLEAVAAREQTGRALSELEITMEQLKLANDQLERMAMTDGLTKVNNRAFFDKTFHEEYRRSQRMKIPLSLIILDIDFFKKINDTYGHPGGDACLRAMGSLIQSKITRAGDIVARFGGEEFVILLPDCDVQNAVKFAEALREQVQQMQVQFDELTICFTASFGVACGSPAASFNTEMLLSQADTALYQAKRDGRNCVRTLADCINTSNAAN